MAFFSASCLKRLVAVLICVVSMVGNFDSVQSLGGGSPDMDLDAAAPPPMNHNPPPPPPMKHNLPPPPPMKHHVPPPPPMKQKLPTRSPIAVQGVVYCKSCKSRGATVTGASPLHGGVVKLVCNNGRRVSVTAGQTDKKGHFFIQPPKVKNYGAHNCKMFLVSSPLQTCKKPTNINGGVTGAALRFEKQVKGTKPLTIYSTGPFAFGPSSCHHFL